LGYARCIIQAEESLLPLIVVTGAAGHVGANLVRELLTRDYTVRALIHRDRRGVTGLEVELAQGDLRDIDSLVSAFTGAELVYHTAAQISISSRGWTRLEAINVAGTRNVVEACLRSGVRRLIHFSSVEALDIGPQDHPVDESTPLADGRTALPYPRSKAASERATRAGAERGLEAVILCPSAILGPHDYRISLANLGLLALARGRLWALVDGGFDWVDVRDVVAGAIAAGEVERPSERYILSGHWASLRDLAELVTEAAGVPAPHLVIPMPLAQLAAPLAERLGHWRGVQPLVTQGSLKPLASGRAISHALAARELDYVARPLRETVADTVAWFRDQNLLDVRKRGNW
jgi:dihydroflavonol-4-reductase